MSTQLDWAQQLDAEFPCRQAQIRALLTLYSTSLDFPLLPSILAVHGPEATGKSTIVRRVLEVVEKGTILVNNNSVDTARDGTRAVEGDGRIETAVMVAPTHCATNPRKRKLRSDEDDEGERWRESEALNSKEGPDPFRTIPNGSKFGSMMSSASGGLPFSQQAAHSNSFFFAKPKPVPPKVPYPPAIDPSTYCARKRVHAIVNCRECVTGRQLFEEMLRQARRAVGEQVDSIRIRNSRMSEKCDSLAVLLVKLENLLSPTAQSTTGLGKPSRRGAGVRGLDEADVDEYDEDGDALMNASELLDDEEGLSHSQIVRAEDIPELVLVLDGIDQQREAPPTLLPALARFGERIEKLSVLLIMRAPAPTAFNAFEVQHLAFPAYSRDEIITIVGMAPEAIFSPKELEEMAEEERAAALEKEKRKAALQDGITRSGDATNGTVNGKNGQHSPDKEVTPAVPVKRGRGRPKRNGPSAALQSVSSAVATGTTATTSTSVYTPAEAAEDAAWLWPRFCAVVWDSIGRAASRDLSSFRRTCRRIWPKFVQPIRDEEYGTRDFAKLMIANRALFGGEREGVGRLRWDRGNAELQAADGANGVHNEDETETREKNGKKWEESSHNLAYYAKFLLCAAYLASYNPPRADITFFVRGTDGTKKRRRRRGGGGGNAGAGVNAGGPSSSVARSSKLASSTPASADSVAAKRGPGRPPKRSAGSEPGSGMKANMRTAGTGDGTVSVASVASAKDIPRTLLNPSTFPLDRLLSITISLLDQHLPPGVPPASSSDLLPQIATLSNLRLLIRSGGSSASTTSSGASIVNAGRGGGGGAGGGGSAALGTAAAAGASAATLSALSGGAGVSVGGAFGNTDLLDPSSVWRVNYGWEFVCALARSVGVEMREYLADDL